MRASHPQSRLASFGVTVTAEVVSSPAGDFRFYAAPGSWTVRALSRVGNGQADVQATLGVSPVDVLVG